jgi:hypothetical protein
MINSAAVARTIVDVREMCANTWLMLAFLIFFVLTKLNRT